MQWLLAFFLSSGPGPLLHLAPDATVLVATVGICMIFLELNRPGTIIPGALGLLLVLFAAASLAQHTLHPGAIAALALCAAALAFNLYRALPVWLLAAVTLALAFAFRFLLASGPLQRPIHTATAVACGGLLGVLAAFLSRVAFRARRLKAVH